MFKHAWIPAACAAMLLAACGGSDSTSSQTRLAAQASDEGAKLSILNVPSLQERQGLSVTYDIQENSLTDSDPRCAALTLKWYHCFTGEITLTNSGAAIPAGASNFALIVPTPRRLHALLTPGWTVTHLTGDLHKFTPNADFKGLPAGGTTSFKLIGEFWQIAQSDFFPNWFVIENDQPMVIANTRDEDVAFGRLNGHFKAFPGDNNEAMTVDTRYDSYNGVPHQIDSKARIVPAVMSQVINNGSVSIAGGIRLNTDQATGLGWATENAVREQIAALGMSVQSQALTLNVSVQPTAIPVAARKPGGYSLVIDAGGVTVRGYDSAGAFYGVQSVLSLVDVKEKTPLPFMQVHDAPRYDYRGHMVDIARNFQSLATLKKVIDEMAIVKLNTLHLHLSDDEGWRLAINGLPELTDVGSRRGFTTDERTALSPQLGAGPSGSATADGFLSRQDFVNLLAYAQSRHIRVIPEFDMPGHARAAVMAMEARYHKLMAQNDVVGASAYRLADPDDTTLLSTVQFYSRQSILNPCVSGTEKFVKKVMSEVAAMYREAGAQLPTWHMGADEAHNEGPKLDDPWTKSPACKQLVDAKTVPSVKELPAYFVKNVSQWALQAGYPNLQGWSDGFKAVGQASQLALPTTINLWDPLFWAEIDPTASWLNKGYSVVVSNPDFLYLDMPNEVDPNEPGYYWASRGTSLKKVFSFAPDNLPQNAETSMSRANTPYSLKSVGTPPLVRGLSTHSWGETVRTPQRLGYMTFPRLYAAAERAWAKAGWELAYKPDTTFTATTQWVNKAALNQDYNLFAGAVAERAFDRLERAGINFRLPKPGAKIVGGVLRVNVEMPNLQVQYDTGSGWQTYSAANPPSASAGAQVRIVHGNQQGKAFTVN